MEGVTTAFLALQNSILGKSTQKQQYAGALNLREQMETNTPQNHILMPFSFP